MADDEPMQTVAASFGDAPMRPWRDETDAQFLARMERRRARVVGGTDGPDQGDPAGWWRHENETLGTTSWERNCIPEPIAENPSTQPGFYRRGEYVRPHEVTYCGACGGVLVRDLVPAAPGAVAAAPEPARCPSCGGNGEYPPPSSGRCGDCGGTGAIPAAAPGAETTTDEDAAQ